MNRSNNISETRIRVYRGESVWNKGGNFYATNPEQARQYTQSGLDKEITTAFIDTDRIYKANPLPFGGDESQMDQAIAHANEHGFSGFWVDEGQGEQPSIFVINKLVLTKRSPLKEDHEEAMMRTWPDKSLDKYLLENKVITLGSETLYHGSPLEGVVSMLVRGIYGQEHNEVAEHEAFSTSLNSEVLYLFSEGENASGLVFEVKGIKIIVLDDIMTFLMTQLPGSGMGAEADEAEVEKFCETFKIPLGGHRRDYYLPYNYLSSLGVDAFMFEYVWKRHNQGHSPSFRDESEICFIGKSIDKLNKLISYIYVEGEEFDKKLPALRAIKRKLRDKA